MIETICQDLINKAKNFTCSIIADSLSTFPEILDNAIIIVGGSVSFGLADGESDIDYGIILPNHSDFIKLEEKLIENIGGRFHNYQGVLIDIHLCSLHSFGIYECLSSSEDEKLWERLDPTDIFNIQNAVIIQDPNGIFSLLKDKIGNIPTDILKRRIVGRWGFLNMWVDFTRQCLKRKDKIGAFTFAGRAIQEIMNIGFLLNGSPFPDPKYRYRLFCNLPKLSNEISSLMEEITSSVDMEIKYNILSDIVNMYSKYMRENEVIDIKYINDWLQCFDNRAESLF